MKDRVSATPGRMLITPENGQPAFYATVELADNPSVEGTPLNKANLLTDSTATAMGLNSSATPNTAFAQLNTKINTNNTRLNNVMWEQIGTANIAGLSNNSSLTINLSKSLSSLTELCIFFENGVCDENNYLRLLYVDFSETFQPGSRSTMTDVSSAVNPGPIFKLSHNREADIEPASGFLHFLFPLGKTKGYFNGVNDYHAYISSAVHEWNIFSASVFNAGTTTTAIKGQIKSSQSENTSSVISGTITVYGRGNS